MRHLPQVRYRPPGAREVLSKKAEAVAYIYERAGNPYAIAYCFKRSKPEWHLRFASEEARAKRIGLFFKGIEAAQAYKAEQAAERKAARSNAGVKIGQVFASSWGYDQTNVDFYEIVELIGNASVKMAKIKKMECSGNWGEGYGDRGYCEPSDSSERRVGEPFIAQVSRSGSSFYVSSAKIYGRGGASAWDGKPMYWSAYA